MRRVQEGAVQLVQCSVVLSRRQVANDFPQMLAHEDFHPEEGYWMRAISLLTSTIAPPNHAA